MSNRLRLWVDITLRQIPTLGFPTQFIPYKKERVNERLALFLGNGESGMAKINDQLPFSQLPITS